jgi:outer membrane immunogenic protein
MIRSLAAVSAAFVLTFLATSDTVVFAAEPIATPPPVFVPPPPPPPPGWEGFYVGGHAGYALATREGCLNSYFFGPDLCDPAPFGLPILFSFDQEGYFLGGQAGYNLALGGGNFILGLEVSASFADINGTFFPSSNAEWNWLASATARAGWGGPNFLIYAEGGLAMADYTFDAGILCDFSSTATGWTAGGGVEMKVGASRRASLFAEYAYYSFPDHENTCGGLGGLLLIGTDVDATMHTVKLGFNYQLGN